MAIDVLIAAGLKILDKVIPDPVEREKAKLELLKQEQSGALEEAKISLSAIIEEAKSADPWTSRARPSFLYVIYLLILFSIPMGFIYATDPILAFNISEGFGAWLKAIPEDLYWLFGAGYLGYTGFRTFDKRQK